MDSLTLLFILCFGVVFYTYVGYGIVLYGMVKVKELLIKPTPLLLPDPLPEVTLLIPAYNEAAVVNEKMENCRSLLYPPEKLKIIWVTDGSEDQTNDLLAQYAEVTTLFLPERKGKMAAMNRVMGYVTTPLVIFSDANTLLNTEAVFEIVRQFSDPGVGCVAGEKRVKISESADAASSGEGIYWKYESTLKKWDSRLCGVTGAAGELFGIRTALYENLPEDTLLDDFVLSLRLVIKGYRTAYCAQAYAMEGGSANVSEEEKRKVRIAAGGLQSVARLSALLNPFRFGIFSFQYISHRVLRWTITPVMLFLLLPLNVLLVLQHDSTWIFTGLLIGQILFYLAAYIGKTLSDKELKVKIFFIPYYFVFMNLSVIKGMGYLIKKKNKGGAWAKAQRKR